MPKDYFVHRSSYVDEGAEIGINTKIWHFSHIMPHAKIGNSCIIGQNVFVGAYSVIGDSVKIQNNVSIFTGVILEDYVFLGPSMVFTNVINPRSHIERKEEFKTTLIKCGATVGANATILCGVTIGEYAFIGAGSVVTHDIPPYALAYGNPSKIEAWICQCGNKLRFTPNQNFSTDTCQECGLQYSKYDDRVEPILECAE